LSRRALTPSRRCAKHRYRVRIRLVENGQALRSNAICKISMRFFSPRKADVEGGRPQHLLVTSIDRPRALGAYEIGRRHFLQAARSPLRVHCRFEKGHCRKRREFQRDTWKARTSPWRPARRATLQILSPSDHTLARSDFIVRLARWMTRRDSVDFPDPFGPMIRGEFAGLHDKIEGPRGSLDRGFRTLRFLTSSMSILSLSLFPVETAPTSLRGGRQRRF